LQLSPDVVTMDIEMPVLDGLSALEKIMTLKPTPVVMVSSLTKSGADSTIRALSLGAVDFVAKTAGPIRELMKFSQELLQKCRAAARVTGTRLQARPIPQKSPAPLPLAPDQPSVVPKAGRFPFSKASDTPVANGEWIVAIGTSTGGPRALQEVLTKFAWQPAVSNPGGATHAARLYPFLAERLNTLCALTVKEAEDNETLLAGTVYVGRVIIT